MEKPKEKNTLKSGLSTRHIKLIALGSAIGTGLFYGSAEAIFLAGPAIILAYLIGGISIFMVMRSLGEMSVHYPTPDSFSYYAAKYVSPWLGFVTGWMFIFEMVIVCLADITAFGIYMQFWFPNIPKWEFILGLVLIIGGINLCTVKIFGEMEFWLSLVKIIAIAAMIVGGVAIMFFNIEFEHPVGVSNLWSYGGFFPTGVIGFLASFSIVMYSFGGMEILGITASEAEDVKKSIPNAINSIPFRVLLFYIMTLGVLMCLYPWDIIGKSGSPFVSIFKMLGIGYVPHILNVVVIVAAISAINSDIFSATRMMFGLAQKGQAWRPLSKVNSHGVPYVAVFVIACVLMIGVVLNYYIPENIFIIITAMAAFATIWVWLTISISHFMFRIRLSKQEAKRLFFKAPFWPLGQIINIIFLLGVIISLWFNPTIRVALYACMVWTIFVLLIYFGFVKNKAENNQ